MAEGSDPFLMRIERLEQKKAWDENEKIQTPVRLNQEEIVILYLMAINETCGTAFRFRDVGFPKNGYSSMQIGGRMCASDGPKQAIEVWLKKKSPQKEFKIDVIPDVPKFGEKTTHRFPFKEMLIEGTSANDYNAIKGALRGCSSPARGAVGYIKKLLNLGP